MTTYVSTPIYPGTTPAYQGDLTNETGDLVPGPVLVTLTLSIVDTDSGAIVNGVDKVNILNIPGGRGTVDGNGHLICTLTAADTTLFNAVDTQENRSLIFDFTYGTGIVKTGRQQVDFVIRATSGP